jgi:hypothetical protein
MDVRRWVVGSVVFCGCHVDERGVAEATSGDAGISSDADGASTGEEPDPDPDPDPDPEPEPHPDAAASCDAIARPPSQPAVVLDVEVACTHTRFADYGARVALGEDAAHLAVGSFYDSFLFDVTAAGATRDDDAPSLSNTRPLLVLDASQRLVLGGTAGSLLEDTIVVATRDPTRDPRWSVSEFPSELSVYATDLDAAADGSAMLGGTGSQDWRLVRDVEGTWTLQAVPRHLDTLQTRRALTPSGSPFTLLQSVAEDDSAWGTDLVISDAPARAFGETRTREPAAVVPALAGTIALPESAPIVVVASGHADGITIDWLDDDGDHHLVVPDTAERVDACPPLQDPFNTCPEPCEDRSRGLEPGTFAVTRAADGGLWLATIDADVDRTVESVWLCDETKGSCTCTQEDIDHGSQQWLRLFAIGIHGAEVAVEPRFEHALGSWWAQGDGDIALDVDGTRVAIAVVVETALLGPGAGGVRTLVVETAP